MLLDYEYTKMHFNFTYPPSEGTETMQSGTFLDLWINSKLCNYYNNNSTFWQDALPDTINCSHW